MPSTQVAAQLPRGASIGRYLVLEKLGQGGMGEVYAAFDPQLNRKVALKLLLSRDSEKDATSRERLLREAQAMAQLSHPNVLPVHDAGEFEGRVFIAMELVQGMNLREWLKASPRAWPDVVRHFLEAGRGLAAAHKAGLVHRDFKPDNVMVGADGRVYVMDFGLARPGGERSSGGGHSGSWDTPEGLESLASQHTLQGASTGLLGSHLTRAGGIIGTPGYMAPEQIRGEGLDARADAFAFCASLYYGLYGKKPFAGRDVREVLQATQAGKVQPPAKDAKVPTWLRRVLLKGLAVEREQRYPTMEALLAALQANPAVRTRRYALVGGALMALAAAAAVPRITAAHRAAECEVEAQGFAQLWSPQVQEAVARSFRATGAPFADVVLRSVKVQLDAYGQKWGEQRQEACLARRVRREATQSELELRAGCLEKRRSEAEALLDVFTQADAKTVERAVFAVGELSSLDACADIGYLLREVKPPQSPELAAQVAEGRRVLGRVKAQLDSGRYAAGLALVGPWVARAKALGYRPLEAEALAYQGELLGKSGDVKAARDLLRDALTAAEASNHDEAKVRAVAELGYYLADDPLHGYEARKWSEWALGLLARVPHSKVFEARIRYNYGWIYERQGKPEEAVPYMRQAVELATAALGADSQRAQRCRSALGAVLASNGELAEAEAIYGQLLRELKDTLGAEHPSLGIALANTARVYTAQGKHAQALDARQQALRIYQRAFAARNPNFAWVEEGMAESLLLLGRHREAREMAQSAIARFEDSRGKDSPTLLYSLWLISEALLGEGRAAESLPYVHRMVALAKTLTDRPEELELAMGLMGQVYLETGRAAEALPLLERGHQQIVAQGKKQFAWNPLYARFLVARATWDLHPGRRADAMKEAHEVLVQLRDLRGAARVQKRVEDWLAARKRT